MVDQNTFTEPEAEDTDVNGRRAVLNEERQLWMTRAFALMVVLAMVCNFILLIALSNVTPVMRVQTFLLQTKDKDQQVISINRTALNNLNTEDLQRSLVRQYIQARHSIDSDLNELEKKWGKDGIVSWMSSDDVYQNFRDNEVAYLIEDATSKRKTREVKIEKVGLRSDSNRQRNIWEAEVLFEDQSMTSVDKETMRVKITAVVQFLPKTVEWQDRLKNPLGFTVTQYGTEVLDEKK